MKQVHNIPKTSISGCRQCVVPRGANNWVKNSNPVKCCPGCNFGTRTVKEPIHKFMTNIYHNNQGLKRSDHSFKRYLLYSRIFLKINTVKCYIFELSQKKKKKKAFLQECIYKSNKKYGNEKRNSLRYYKLICRTSFNIVGSSFMIITLHQFSWKCQPKIINKIFSHFLFDWSRQLLPLHY